MKIFGLAALAAVAILATSSPSQAQVDHSHARAWDAYERGSAPRATTRRATRGTATRTRSKSILARIAPAIAREPIAAVANTVGSIATQILPHPSGCPRTLFCGCGAALEVFGSHRRDLWLARNWLKFPPAAPAAGMVAANTRHVMVIRQYLGNNRALVYDANSGRGLTRLHVRSLAGFSVRNPRA